MPVGVGADIFSVERMRSQVGSPLFMRRVFTEAEMNVGRWRPDAASYYAKVFAAKEAVLKCFGIAADGLGTWLDIEIEGSEGQQPRVRLHGLVATLARARGTERVLLSLSSENEYAVAFAVLLRGEPEDD